VEDNVKRSELAAALSNETGLPKKKAREVVELFFEEMSNVLAAGDRVEIRDFCSFSVKDYKASTGRNPNHGRKVEMKKLKKDLQAVTKEFKALTKKIGQLTTKLKKTAVHELEHAQAAIKLKPPVQHAAGALKTLTKQTDKLIKAVDRFEKDKVAKRKKAKPKPTKKARPTKAAAKKAPPKKTKTVTATDQVLKIIRRSKKGVDVPTLVKKTGLTQTTVRNIVFKATKQGKIKRVGRGIYIAA
jgi:integration host factor subunit beta